MIELSNIRLEKSYGKNRLVCDLKSNFSAEKTMWFSAPLEYGDIFTAEVYDAFLCAILYPAMYFREDIVIHGKMSKKFFKNVVTYVKKVLLAYSDDLSDIAVTADGYGKVTKTGSLVGTGFSAGVDSFATFVTHYANEDDADYKINALFFFNVGSHGRFSNPHTLERFHNRYDACRAFPDSLHIPFIPVDSNVHAFHEIWGHQRTVSITLAAGILAVQKVLSKYFVSSTNAYSELPNQIQKAKNFDLAEFADPYLLPLLSPDGLDIIPDGEQYLRTEKTRLIADFPPARRFLNVCVKSDDGYTTAKNCSACSKCLRTLFALDSMNRLGDFSDVFDLAVYRKKAFAYKCRQRVLYKKDPFAKDNVDFAKKSGMRVPPLAIAFLVTLPATTLRAAKRLLAKSARLVLGKNGYDALKTKVKSYSVKKTGRSTDE